MLIGSKVGSHFVQAFHAQVKVNNPDTGKFDIHVVQGNTRFDKLIDCVVYRVTRFESYRCV